MFIVQAAVFQSIEKLNEKSFYKAIDELKKYDGKLYDFKEMDGRITMWTENKALVLGAEMAFYEKKGDSDKYNQLLTDFIKSIWNDQTALNSFAWSYYQRFDDKNKLEQAVKCIKRSIELNSNYNNNDTFASLLYKLGDYNKALEQAKAAIVLAKEKNIDFAATNELIEKIKEKQKQ
jgi:tetratricopeptide (TPR) repeat protein